MSTDQSASRGSRRQFLHSAVIAPIALAATGSEVSSKIVGMPRGADSLNDDAKEFLAAWANAETFIKNAPELPPGITPESEAEDAELDRLLDIVDAVGDRIMKTEPTDWRGLVAQAITTKRYVQDTADGSWSALRQGIFERSTSETCLSILIMAGLTDGKIERDGNGTPLPTLEDIRVAASADPAFDRSGGAVAAFVEAFGGTKVVAGFTGVSNAAVQDWCERGFISQGFTLRLFLEATRRGIAVDPAALDTHDQLADTMNRLQSSNVG